MSAYLGVTLPVGELIDDVQSERIRLNDVVAERPDAQAYLEKLEEVAPPTTIASGDELAAEVERFLRETTGEDRNPFDGP